MQTEEVINIEKQLLHTAQQAIDIPPQEQAAEEIIFQQIPHPQATQGHLWVTLQPENMVATTVLIVIIIKALLLTIIIMIQIFLSEK